MPFIPSLSFKFTLINTNYYQIMSSQQAKPNVYALLANGRRRSRKWWERRGEDLVFLIPHSDDVQF